jgi:hypothetical protein
MRLDLSYPRPNSAAAAAGCAHTRGTRAHCGVVPDGTPRAPKYKNTNTRDTGQTRNTPTGARPRARRSTEQIQIQIQNILVTQVKPATTSSGINTRNVCSAAEFGSGAMVRPRGRRSRGKRLTELVSRAPCPAIPARLRSWWEGWVSCRSMRVRPRTRCGSGMPLWSDRLLPRCRASRGLS